MKRRDFLTQVGALGLSQALFPGWLPRLAFGQTGGARGDVLVCIFLRGGIDGLNTLVPYGEGAAYYDPRPSQHVAESAVLDLDGFFGLHPALAPVHELYQQGAVGFVHAAGLTNPTRSHFDAMQFMEYGTPGRKDTGTGWIGRHLQTAAWQNDSPFRAIGLGAMLPSSLYGAPSPLSLRSIADFHLRGRQNELHKMQQSLERIYSQEAAGAGPQLREQAALVFRTLEWINRLDAEAYQPANGAVYPDTELGRGLKQTALLIKAEVGLEVACLDLGGWDTHENQGTFGGVYEALLSGLGGALAAFYADMQDHMGQISLVTMSEFGRRVAENGSAGTDHGHGNFMLLMGGGLAGGRVYSDWPGLAPEALNDGDLAITTDYRDVLAEILLHRVGNPALAQIFPDYRPTPLGLWRPQGT